MTRLWLQVNEDELLGLVTRQVPETVRTQAWELWTKHQDVLFQQALQLKSYRKHTRREKGKVSA